MKKEEEYNRIQHEEEGGVQLNPTRQGGGGGVQPNPTRRGGGGWPTQHEEGMEGRADPIQHEEGVEEVCSPNPTRRSRGGEVRPNATRRGGGGGVHDKEEEHRAHGPTQHDKDDKYPMEQSCMVLLPFFPLSYCNYLYLRSSTHTVHGIFIYSIKSSFLNSQIHETTRNYYLI
jgi:hypothetical protein